jgi:hypothetical protein
VESGEAGHVGWHHGEQRQAEVEVERLEFAARGPEWRRDDELANHLDRIRGACHDSLGSGPGKLEILEGPGNTSNAGRFQLVDVGN